MIETPVNQFEFEVRAGSRRYITIDMSPNLASGFHIAAVAQTSTPVTFLGDAAIGDPAIAYTAIASGSVPTEFSFQFSSPNAGKVFKIPFTVTTNAPDPDDANTAEAIVISVIVKVVE